MLCRVCLDGQVVLWSVHRLYVIVFRLLLLAFPTASVEKKCRATSLTCERDYSGFARARVVPTIVCISYIHMLHKYKYIHKIDIYDTNRARRVVRNTSSTSRVYIYRHISPGCTREREIDRSNFVFHHESWLFVIYKDGFQCY